MMLTLKSFVNFFILFYFFFYNITTSSALLLMTYNNIPNVIDDIIMSDLFSCIFFWKLNLFGYWYYFSESRYEMRYHLTCSHFTIILFHLSIAHRDMLITRTSQTHTQTHKHTHTNTNTHTHTHTYIHIHIHTRTHTHSHTLTHIFACIHCVQLHTW